MGKQKKPRPQMPAKKTAARANTGATPAELKAALQRGLALFQSGQLRDAEQLFQSVLTIDPKNVNALQLLGLTRSQLGEFRESEQLLRRAIKQRPKMADLHYHLGNTLGQQGKLKQAVDAYRSAIKLGANNEWTHNNLGGVLSKLERYEEAQASIGKAVNINPNDPFLLSNYGFAAWKANKPDDAIEALNKALEIDPSCVDALSNLGIIYLAKLELDRAENYLRRALEIDAQDFNAVNNLAAVLLSKNNNDEALTMISRALELNPKSTDAMLNMAKALSRKDDRPGALALYHRVLDIVPRHVVALIEMGTVLTTQGDLDEARKCYQKALKIDPRSIGARVGLISMNPANTTDDEIRNLERVYENHEISKLDQVRIAFCLAKTFEKNSQHSKAFSYLADGNSIKRMSYEYDSKNDQAFFNRIKMTFTQQFFQEHTDSGVEDKTPIFILGMPRSGTTLIEQILSSHPQVFGAGELLDMRQLIENCSADNDKEFPELAEQLGSDDFANLGRDYIERLRQRSNSTERVTDKMPHNFLYVGMIRLMLPNAKVIHCKRNPIDNCLSIYKQYFLGLHKYAYDQSEIGAYYLLYQDLMHHWHKVLPGFMLDLQYEDMIADQERTTRQLLEFCDLPWDESCLQFHKSERAVKTASKFQVRQEIYSDSVELWRRYEQELKPLIDALG